jgi:octaprenyl-diphosphate synthase
MKQLKNKTTDVGRVLDAYSDDLRRVEKHLREMFSNENLLVQSTARHLLRSGGKRLRPLFLLMSARMSGYRGSDNIPLAGIVEVIHTASLLHDDVVDEADLRRGNPTGNSIWGNATVVLVGDYLYSNALKYAVTFSNLKIIKSLSSAITCMTDGELLQLQRTSDITITESEYVRIASGKTGALFSEACRIGGILCGVSDEHEEALASYGMNVGIAFQMMDDILDYSADEGELGKKLGKDLEEGKITLPLICLLKAASPEEREEIRQIVESPSDDGLGRISTLIRHYEAINESLKRAQAVVEEAKAKLMAFPESEERAMMMGIADYALYREK